MAMKTFSLVVLSGSLHGRRNCICLVYFIRGVFDVQAHHYHRYTLCIYALHKWTKHIFVKWPTGNNGIHHEENNLKVSHHPTAHHQNG